MLSSLAMGVLTTMLVAIAGFGGVGAATSGGYKGLSFVVLIVVYVLGASFLPRAHFKSQPEK